MIQPFSCFLINVTMKQTKCSP